MTYKLFEMLLRQETGEEVVSEYKFHPKRKWKFDLAIPGKKIAVEIEGGVYTGGRHTRGRGYVNDMEKYNNAVLLGWRLLRFTPDQLKKWSTIEMIKSLL